MPWIVRDQAEADAWREAFDSPSPRVTTIICGAILDVALEEALRSRLIADEPKVAESMFKIDGALGPFAPKVRLGYLLGMYTLEERNALSTIGRIRNAFAHQSGNVALVFRDPAVSLQFSDLRLHETYTHYPALSDIGIGDVPLETRLVPPGAPADRVQFLANFRILRQKLICDQFYHLPNSNVPATPAEAVRALDQRHGSREAWLQISRGRCLLGPQKT